MQLDHVDQNEGNVAGCLHCERPFYFVDIADTVWIRRFRAMAIEQGS